MMTFKEINEFLTSFNTTSYNISQIGNNKQIIINIYEFLKKLNISKENIDIIIEYIAYFNIDNTNIALYLELLSKSIGFATQYDLKEVIRVIKEIHDIYYDESADILLEEYLHDTQECRIKKLFLNRNNKYLNKAFKSNSVLSYISDLKFATAIVLKSKEYKEFVNYIDNFENYQDSYSPLLVFKTYTKIRKELKEEKRLFWDILFGNEYIVALSKNNILITDIYKENIYNKPQKENIENEIKQLDIFAYLEENIEKDIININDNISTFQICTIYNISNLPEYEEEKDLLMYYEKLLNNKDMIILPKLKGKEIRTYQYELN